DDSGGIINTDLLASAIKEATASITPTGLKDKDVYLILPPESFQFMRAEVPADIAPTAVSSFVMDKARQAVSKDLENYVFDYLIQDNEQHKQIIFYAFDKEALKSFQEVLSLVDLSISNILPGALAYFKLFEKTLRKEKREYILYILYGENQTTGYLFDSFGPIDNKRWHEEQETNTSIEKLLKSKVTEYAANGIKLNRLILSGECSENVRQDTFTKNVGVWTNPLKRIIPQFYQDYLKIFILPSNKTLPLLTYDVCIGAFIFVLESKTFSLLKKKFPGFSTSSLPKGAISLPVKEIVIFISSFALSFLTFIALSNFDVGKLPPLPLLAKPTATPTPVPPTPTPTISVNKKELKIKVLNGSGMRGKATEVKDLLTEKGYGEILTGNADNFDYATTEIQVKKEKKHIANAIKTDLKEQVESPKVTDLDDDAASDAVIIFGSDFK
ncbi:LytR C-terminal domain-containing protein, partial [Candidatus Roizmanbacteria bacterium]|nr:LytR C-terminal domain-containing protein [Candidatus Roizmanbacteria bacterium]